MSQHVDIFAKYIGNSDIIMRFRVQWLRVAVVRVGVLIGRETKSGLCEICTLKHCVHVHVY